MNFNYTDYPAIFKTADSYSLTGQNRYINLIKIELGILLVATVISLFPFDDENFGRGLAIFSALSFLAGIGITFYIKNSKFEDQWYMGRALAESIKSLTWKYMMRSIPFNSDLPVDAVNKKYNKIMSAILSENESFLKDSYEKKDLKNITAKMQNIRQLSFQESKNIYINDRIKNQQKWYKEKANDNKACASRLFYLIILFQVIAFIYSIYLIYDPPFFNAVPLATTLAAVFLSWMQVKQHQELSQSYAVAANEIGLILAQSTHIDTEEKLKQYVSDSENAFSREHILWTAKREMVNYESI